MTFLGALGLCHPGHDRCYFFQGSDGRIIFAIPYEQDFTLIGTTDVDRLGHMVPQHDPQHAWLAGSAGPSAQGALDAVIQSPGEGARTALARIDDRAVAAGQRLTGQLDQSLTGTGVGAPSTRQFSDTGCVCKAISAGRPVQQQPASPVPGRHLQGAAKT
ncbi:hypothetical protein DPM13_15775 [Paracoccus mutanolyticus]|uniref:Uncharacterized protein n=1 Tax=Paracoccus mutanolyticus TaxID=1499308 RepID=A0ABM6WTG4_9RHOB|nr:hypothetical protein [Paracoccus mutanolyticus]AWX93941.1 hypothetical protein DPM13_15775 [Paracoccus mutanolyticus]